MPTLSLGCDAAINAPAVLNCDNCGASSISDTSRHLQQTQITGGKPIHSSRSKVLKMVTLVSFVVAFAISCCGSSRQSQTSAINAIPPRHPSVMLTGALRRTDAYRDARRALLSKRYALAQTLLHSLLQRPWITVSDRTFIARQLHLVRAAAAKGGAR